MDNKKIVVNGFEIIAEDPIPKGNGRKSIYDPRIAKIRSLPHGWYVIGVVQSLGGAASAVVILRKRYKDVEFRSVQSDDKKASKVYARVIKQVPDGKENAKTST